MHCLLQCHCLFPLNNPLNKNQSESWCDAFRRERDENENKINVFAFIESLSNGTVAT